MCDELVQATNTSHSINIESERASACIIDFFSRLLKFS
jgi:hypothetical protein